MAFQRGVHQVDTTGGAPTPLRTDARGLPVEGWPGGPGSLERPLDRGAQTAGEFMASVHRWMVGGLALTAAISMWIGTQPELFFALSGWMMPLLLVELGVVLAFSFLAHRVGKAAAAAMFITYAALNGVTLSFIFYAYHLGSVATAFSITSGAFLALSIYGTVTKRDLSAFGTFLIMGLFGVLIAGVVNIFLNSSMVSFVVACASVIVFAGLTAWDTQKLRALHAATGGAGAAPISGALTLYLDFINLFLAILRLMGRRR